MCQLLFVTPEHAAALASLMHSSSLRRRARPDSFIICFEAEALWQNRLLNSHTPPTPRTVTKATSICSWVPLKNHHSHPSAAVTAPLWVSCCNHSGPITSFLNAHDVQMVGFVTEPRSKQTRRRWELSGNGGSPPHHCGRSNGESLSKQTLSTSLTYIWTQAINGSGIMRQWSEWF